MFLLPIASLQLLFCYSEMCFGKMLQIINGNALFNFTHWAKETHWSKLLVQKVLEIRPVTCRYVFQKASGWENEKIIII